MISTCIKWLTPVCAFAILSCAEPPTEPAREKKIAPSPPPKPTQTQGKNPPRLHGRAKVSSISLADFFALHQSNQVLVIDARPTLFHRFGHIPGALSIPPKSGDSAITKHESQIKSAIADGKTLVVYCSGYLCPDARNVAMQISGFGYPSSVFSGGWDAWKDAGMPTE
jgi:rhodanese-related sulfurtransferase